MTLSDYIINNLKFLGFDLSSDNANAVKYFLESEIENLFGSDVNINSNESLFLVNKVPNKNGSSNKIVLQSPDLNYTFLTRAKDLVMESNKENEILMAISTKDNKVSCTSYSSLNTGYKKEIQNSSISKYSLTIYEDITNNDLTTYSLTAINTKIGNKEYFDFSKDSQKESNKPNSFLYRLHQTLTENNLRFIYVRGDDDISYYYEEIFNLLEEEKSKDKTLQRKLYDTRK